MILQRIDDDRPIECNGNTFVGRGLIDGINLDDPGVSALHAVIAWHPSKNCWLLHDLGSQNGTRVGSAHGDAPGERVAPGVAVRIDRGRRLTFARTMFDVIDTDGPPASAVCLTTGEVRTASDGVLLLPDERAPDVMLVETQSGWVRRSPSEAVALDGTSDVGSGDEVLAAGSATVSAGGRSWRLWHPAPAPQTQRFAVSALQCEIEVVVSPTSDHIRLVLRTSDQVIALPSRRHHELVWLLARARLEDIALPELERGWRDAETLLAQMALRESGVGYISVLTHRLRNQLKARKLADHDRMIERRDGQLRLAVARVRVLDLGRVDP